MAFLLDDAVAVRPSRVARRRHIRRQGPSLNWLRLGALGLNLILWAAITFAVRHFIARYS